MTIDKDDGRREMGDDAVFHLSPNEIQGSTCVSSNTKASRDRSPLLSPVPAAFQLPSILSIPLSTLVNEPFLPLVNEPQHIKFTKDIFNKSNTLSYSPPLSILSFVHVQSH